MKKVLFATTALVAFAGAAAAEVTVSGSAEMGIAGGSIDGAADVNTTFFTSVDVRFAMSGTADNGLTFGAIIDLEDALDTAVAGRDTTDQAGEFADYTVFISGEFGTLTLGDTDGAIDWAMDDAGNIGNPGTLADDETSHAGYNGFGGELDSNNLYNGQNLRYDYTVGDFGIAMSVQVDDNPATDGDPAWQIAGTYGFAFTGGSVDLGLGYGDVSDTDSATPGSQGVSIWAVSAAMFLDNGLSAGVTYTDISDDGFFGDDGNHLGIGVGYEFGPWGFHANWGEYDWDANATVEDSDGYGLAVAYDFGGGLSAHLGYGSSDIGAFNATPVADRRVDDSTWSFGLAMSF